MVAVGVLPGVPDSAPPIFGAGGRLVIAGAAVVFALLTADMVVEGGRGRGKTEEVVVQAAGSRQQAAVSSVVVCAVFNSVLVKFR